jgi:hypothetical protein
MASVDPDDAVELFPGGVEAAMAQIHPCSSTQAPTKRPSPPSNIPTSPTR